MKCQHRTSTPKSFVKEPSGWLRAAAARPADLVDRNFTASRPNQLWVADLERHEALLDRAVVKDHRWQPVAAG